MQADSIIEKAKKLGIDPGSSVSQADQIRAIANELGVEDLTELEETLDSMLNDSENIGNNVDNLYDNIEEDHFSNPEGRNYRFGEKEYNEAKNESGVYDKNYYANRGNELDEKVKSAEEKKANTQKEVTKKNEQGEKVVGQKNKNIFDKAKDNADLIKARNDRFQNKLNGAKAKAYNVMHPGEALKDKAKSAIGNAAKSAGKKVGQSAAKAGAAAGKAIGKGASTAISAFIKFAASNPIVLAILGVALVILLILLLIAGGTPQNSDLFGYYDTNCNFNETTVTLKSCNESQNQTMNLKDYVLGMTYSYTKENNYSDETIKALMVIIKTNALSKGNYNSSRKSVTIDDCDMEYTSISEVAENKLEEFEDIYNSIETILFISESYKSEIKNLSSRDSLLLDNNIIEEIESLSSSNSYSKILEIIYNEETTNEDIEEEYRETIFVGDSRMNSMKLFGIVNDSNSVYAGAMGYYWFNGDGGSTFDPSTYNCQINGINCINNKLSHNSTNIVSWLGVNDATNYELYYKKYYELATTTWKDHYIYVVSVGYVDDSRSQYVQNNQIVIFNEYMSENINKSGLDNLIYIDLGYSQTEMANGTLDGVHYSQEFSQQVYDNIINQIGSSTNISATKKIYSMNTYCTYYNLTANDAYWWPIGSAEPTQGSNIYGGEPTSTYISSKYGYRIHPVHGTYTFHGGVDIAAGSREKIIATKSGEVIQVSDFCTGRGDGCNGGAGNMVVVDHGEGIISRYLHMYPGSTAVNVGDKVAQGQLLGLIGSTGTSTGEHLHFEIRINGSTVNPLDYIDAKNPRQMTIGSIIISDDEDASLSREEAKLETCRLLIKSGFSKNAVAGMMVNIEHEGGFKTNNLENCYEAGNCCPNVREGYGFCNKGWDANIYANDISYTNAVDTGLLTRDTFVNDRAGYGLIQWTASSRKSGLYDYSKSQGKSIASLSLQLGWLIEELKQEAYATTWKYVTGNYSASEIAYNFCYNFEVPYNTANTCSARNPAAMLELVNNNCS